MQDQIDIISADGLRVPTLAIRKGGAKLLVASHGITTEKTEEGFYTDFFATLPPDYDVLSFDFRGHGDSEVSSDEVTVVGEILDLMAVFGWAQKNEYEDIYHVATSFGASITLLASSIYDLSFLNKVVFWNPVISYANTFIDAKVEWGKTYFNQSSVEELASRPGTPIPETNFVISPKMTQELLLLHPEATKWPANIPLRIYHGDSDSLVPVEDAMTFAQENTRVELKIIKGVDHGFDDSGRDVMSDTVKWLNG